MIKFLRRLSTNNFTAITSNAFEREFTKKRSLCTTKIEDIKSTKIINHEDKNILLSLQNTLQSRLKPFSMQEWKQIRSGLIKSQKFINEINVDATILGLCGHSANHLDIAKSYIDFLKYEGFELNNASLGRLMKIYYLVYKSDCENNGNYQEQHQQQQQQQRKLTDDDKNNIIEIYDMMLKKYKILDSITCENLIHGIIATNKWKFSLDLLNMIELTCKPSVSAYSVIITRAFDPIDGDEDIAWKLLNEMISNNKQPKCEIFLMYLKRCKYNKNTFIENIEKMFEFLEKNEILITRLVADKLKNVIKECNSDNNMRVMMTTITRNGTCNSCKLKMKNVSLTNDEFTKLSTTFLDKVLIRKDIFLKSLPDEVDFFVKFIDRQIPYDCVIDGLNVAFSCGTKKSPNTYAKLVASVVKYFVQRKKKVLVIGREHMKKWPKEQMMYIKNNSSLFLTKNLSQDDPFLLYATLKSGPKTDFFSRDLMRSHAFLLGNDLKGIFRRWQIEHQYMILKANESGEVLIKEPVKHYLTPHKMYSTWHIPFREVYVVNPGDEFEIPNNWLCINLQNKASES